jgi:hypothetical protein
MTDMVNEPPHYKNSAVKIEPIEVLKYMDFCLGNAFKYVIRAGKKGDFLEDLKKAQWYFNMASSTSRLSLNKEDENIFNVLMTFFMRHTENPILKGAANRAYGVSDYPRLVKEEVNKTIASLTTEEVQCTSLNSK